MPTTYRQANVEDQLFLESVRDELEPALTAAEVRVKLMFAYSDPDDVKPALTHNGYPCAGIAKINSLKDRAEGKADGTVFVDHDQWRDWDEARRRAVCHHELHHFEPQFDKDGGRKTDDLGRPVLKIRKHDWQLGGFGIIVERHGDAAIEKESFIKTAETYGQMIMEWDDDEPEVAELTSIRKAHSA
jgi:hypothetical protein